MTVRAWLERQTTHQGGARNAPVDMRELLASMAQILPPQGDVHLRLVNLQQH